MAGSLWDRDLAAKQLRPQLWRYLSGAARIYQGEAVRPELSLSRSDLVRIFATHLALAETTQSALAAAHTLLDQMPSSAALQHIELPGEVRGQVDWPRSHERRVVTGDPTLFVCSPPERRYDTPLGRLIHLALRCITRLSDLSSLPARGQVGSVVHETSDQARRLLLHPKLSKVRRVDARSLRHTDDLVSRRPLAKDLVDLVHQYVAGIVEGDTDELRRLLERQFLAPDDDSRLFELQVGFDLLTALQTCGFAIDPPLPLLPGGKAPFALVRKNGGQGSIYWQRPAWVLAPDLSQSGAWWRTLDDNNLPKQPLRPDFVVDLPAINRRFIVEVKLTSLAEGSPDRDGLRDAIAYLADADDVFREYEPPHAIVVAWNSTATNGNPLGVIRVCSQETWRDDLVKMLSFAAIRRAE
ncbi:hypothetical protein [Rhodococcus sp. T7]|uniref:hypothetical protein n=1 Tax=Rhodococcus sp. T7 TaxID=627444 RepID=UPI00135BC669|nr:hypothetical protein [Rhodococcus sp. T7]KAF0957308.1 hypothetical protein MLGJGCBP_09138 [Rhodococcus sp. T7]KAF0959199.1 hypothetical protein MLGJGCBP_07712 [Rhodococcus sp. T7]